MQSELLAIVEAFKTWRHYLEGCKHEVLVLTDHNNLRRFMGTKSLSSRQVRWAQELSSGQGQWGCSCSLSLPPREASMKKKSFDLSGLSLNSETNLSPLHRVFICGTHVLPQLRQFWTDMRTELADEHPYRDSIGGMRLRLAELQESDEEVRKIRAECLDGYEEVDGVLHHQGLPFVPKIIRTELISRHHDDPLAGHFGIDKTRELIGRKYYWPSLRRDVEAYVKGCDICLSSKALRHKRYGDPQALPVPTHRWKDLSIDFVTGLPISTN